MARSICSWSVVSTIVTASKLFLVYCGSSILVNLAKGVGPSVNWMVLVSS